MQEKPAKVRIELDWCRLLGFDQAPAPACESERARSRVALASLGTKVGIKRGFKKSA